MGKMIGNEKRCKVEACNNPPHAKGYCGKHWSRLKRHGTLKKPNPKRQFENIEGQRFGDLVVMKETGETKHGNIRWLCRCDCGNLTKVSAGNLKTGHVVSCGCRRRPHGFFGTRLYNVWTGMKKRCLNSNNIGFPRYGGRGIRICDKWMSFIPFRDWALVNGYQENLQIDRIENDGNYKPSNCRFVTSTINNQNRSVTKLSAKQVILIRFLLKSTNLQQKQIGGFFNVRQSIISQIKNRKLWANITKEDWRPI